MTKKTRWVWGCVCIATVVAGFLLFLYRAPLLLKAGRFMAPQEPGAADVVILEGAEVVETGAARAAIELLSAGTCSRLIVVLHVLPGNKKQYGLDDEYPGLVKKKLLRSGLAERQVAVIETPEKVPRTLNEANIVLETLSGEGVRRALLLARGFHTRRSFLVYQHVGQRLGILIVPRAYFSEYPLNDWWTHLDGIEDFATEAVKLLYYQVRGYIPFKYIY